MHNVDAAELVDVGLGCLLLAFVVVESIINCDLRGIWNEKRECCKNDTSFEFLCVSERNRSPRLVADHHPHIQIANFPHY